jgi:hypothetical protein
LPSPVRSKPSEDIAMPDRNPRDVDFMEATTEEWNTMFNLWRLCGRARCLRARACTGHPDCWDHNLALLPALVRDFAEHFATIAQEQHLWPLTYNKALDRLTGDTGEALRDWDEAVKESLGEIPPRRDLEEEDD